ncbi:hypothetical protein ACQ4PT_038449 [Festuca glaucescens]
MSTHGQNDDDDFVDPPPRSTIPSKFVPPTSRCTPVSVSSIVKAFCPVKKKLVSEMGLDGMLKLPDIVNNKEFSYWTLSRVSCDDVAIRMGDGSLLPFSDEDVYKVLHIPCTGKELLVPSNDEISAIKKIICLRFKVADYKSINRALLDDILSKKYGPNMSDDEKAAFKTAFLILVMTKFLAPQALLDNICPRYFAALRDLDDIPNWNWARYVINDIISAARALGNKLSDETRCSYINGCVIFLQVFYLDNLDFGPLNIKHEHFPRIAAYGRDAIKVRMNIDLKEKGLYKPSQFGKMQLRQSSDVCYNRSSASTQSAATTQNAPGPSNVGPDGIQLERTSNQLLKVAEASNLLDSLESVSLNADNQSRNQQLSDSKASIDLNRSVHVVQDPPSLRDMDVPSFDLGLDLTPEKEISKTAGGPSTPLSPRSLSREIAASSCIILDDMFIENSKGELKPVGGIKREYPEPRLLDFGLGDKPQRQRLKTACSSSFDCNAANRVRPDHISSVLIDWIKNHQTNDTLRSSWVAHSNPTPLKLTGMDVKNFIEGNDRVDYPTMMIYTRRLLQKDYEKIGNTDAYGSHHYLEADFAVHAIAGDSLWNPEMFRNQFTGPNIRYDVSKCKNIYVQYCDVNHWNCYAFDLHQHVIHILDSSKSEKTVEVHPDSKHHWIVPMLARAMQECLALFFADWTEDVTDWDYDEPVVPTQSFDYHSDKIDTHERNASTTRNADATMPMEYLSTEVLDPSRGQLFLAETDAFQFCNLYALRKGFGIRIHKQVKNVSGIINNIDYVCSCEGKPSKGVQKSIKKGCKAMMRIHRNDDDKWTVTKFLDDHNHDLTSTLDQNKAMENAIKEVLPNTVHQWCKWHVFNTSKEHLGTTYSNHPEFKDKFHKVLNHARTIDEFEDAWRSIIEEYDLHDNTYLQKVYDDRNRWASPYFKSCFFAKMTTTQRSECMNHVLKGYVSPSSTMHNFVIQYDKFIADRIEAEDNMEFATSKGNRRPRSGSPIERKAATVYTDSMFSKFSDQVYMSAAYNIQEIRDDGTYVTVHMDVENRERWSKLVFPVHVNKEKDEFKCICKLFEHMGILCCHILKVMTHIGYPTLPDKYILKRWTKHARIGAEISLESLRKDKDAAASRTHRHNLLFHACMDLSSKGDISVDAFHIAMRHITEAVQQIDLSCTPEQPTTIPHTTAKSTNLAEPEKESSGSDEEEDAMEEEQHDAVLPPDRRKKRGRPRASRYKKQIEGGIRKKKKCSFCGQKGHYRTGCSENPENATKSKIEKVCKRCKLPGHNSKTCGPL